VIIIGFTLRYIFKSAKEPGLRHAMICAALAWLVIALISSIPFIVIAGMPFLDAFFEGMSGWTGTGLTMIKPSEECRTILFWRSLMQWVGGVGVIVLMLSILARPGTGAFTLYRAESREEKIRPSVISTTRTIWWIYLLYTVIGIIILFIAGMSPWDAINHGMTGLATGGFSTQDGSIGSYNNPMIEVSCIFLMILGVVSFAVHYDVLRGNLRRFFTDTQNKAFCIIAILGVAFLTFELAHIYGIGSFRLSSFQFISGLSCTGFQTANIQDWRQSAKLVIAAAMVIGGAAGSTAGGIKLIRGVLLSKSILWKIREGLLPRKAVVTYKLGKKRLGKEEADRQVAEAGLISFLWIIFLFIGVLVLSYLTSATIEDIVFEVASAQGNVGLSTGITGPDLSPIGKIMLIFNMWIGRLEIIPVMMLFRSMIKGLKPF
jgi:trk system potassium uptake protein TrkH